MTLTKSYYVRYWSTDVNRSLLGGVRSAVTSRFELREDAEKRLAGIRGVHANLDMPLCVAGEIKESPKIPEIFSDGSCLGCKWGKAAKVRDVHA